MPWAFLCMKNNARVLQTRFKKGRQIDNDNIWTKLKNNDHDNLRKKLFFKREQQFISILSPLNMKG